MLDGYLSALLSGGADALQLKDGDAPTLFFGGEQSTLSDVPIVPGTVGALATDWLDTSQLDTLRINKKLKGNVSFERFGHLEFVFRVLNDVLVVALRPSRLETDDDGLGSTEMVLRRLNAAPDAQSLLIQSVLAGASDILFSAGRPCRIRFGQGFFPVERHRFSAQAIEDMLGGKFGERKRQELANSGSADLAIEFLHGSRSFRFRINVFKQFNGLAAAWRPIRDEIPLLGELGLPDEVNQIKDIDHGLVLISGPTGSGKSTTVAALLDSINRTERRHCVTLEDPVEYRFEDQLSLIHQREVGEHVDSFLTGLRAALREAPNVIFVGEMRDLETISAALTAAETGHLVVSTLHSGSCVQAVERIVDVFPEHQQQQVRIQLAEVLKIVVTQRLVPRKKSQLRVPACEMLVVNFAISNLIRERRTHQIYSNLQTGQNQGMLSFERSLIQLIKNDQITPETALRIAPDPKQIEVFLGEKK
jgi:twitching motility protein PilT